MRRSTAYRQALPKPLGSAAAFERAGERFRIAIPLPADMKLDAPYFFPLTDGVIDYAAAQDVSRSGDTLIVETKAGGEWRRDRGGRGRARARRRHGCRLEAAGRRARRRSAARRNGRPGTATIGAILAALLGALLGGLLLNIMPCVFPILSLKALSLAKAGGDEQRREARGAGLHRGRRADLPRARRGLARACAPAGSRPAGRSSCRIRA